jgi:DNA-directed RNA polymerase specialized sigma24 family protein
LLCRRASALVAARARRQAGFPGAEDLAQITLTRLLAAYGEAELMAFDDTKLAAYGYTTLHRVFVNEGYRKGPELAAKDEHLQSALDALGAESGGESAESHPRLEPCLGELAADAQRFIVRTVELESAPLAQQELGWPQGSASNACHRAKKLLAQLRDCLGRQEVGT